MCSSLLTATVHNSSHDKLPVYLQTVQVYHSRCHELQSTIGEESWLVPTFVSKVTKKESFTINSFLIAAIHFEDQVHANVTCCRNPRIQSQ